MKTMTRALLLVLALVLCVGALAACNGDDASTETESQSTSESSSESSDAPDEPTYDTITVAEAIAICAEHDEPTTERYYIEATITAVTNAQYGAMTIADDTGSIAVYRTDNADGSVNYSAMEDKPYKGDKVLMYCTLQNFNGTPEVKSAYLISFEKVEVEVDEKDYTDMTVAAAREAAVGTKIKVDGVVARITYADGKKPMGVYLVDDTQSIYVYDADLAQRVNIGNTVTILGSKAYWILDSEQSSAEKFGYQGCCQLEDVTLLNLDESVTEFNKSWITESTVKDLLETPVTENITTTIHKVNALVKKVEGTGFVNYYFFDLDSETGSYTYTQCSGADFAWLDEFDGKICTVYLSIINAKSSGTDCFFRLLPIEVKDEGFVFDTADTAEHVVNYYGLPQFRTTYTGNPEIKMTTVVSSSLLGFEGATLSYASSNEAAVYFTEVDGKVIFNCGSGQATVTVTGSYNGQTYEATLTISVVSNQTYDTITVKEAQETAVDETVTVKGIVGPSVVNQNAFYLFDGTGMIAVKVNDASIFDSIEIGHEIVIRGMRECYKDDDKTHAGQTCIVDAEVLANYYGAHDYPTDGFITDKTLADIYALNNNEDHTTEVYVVKATVNVVETAYYTTISLIDGDTKLSLYCSSAGQYGFLKAFANQEVTLEIAPCNWNNKNYYVGCVLAVYTEDGKILNELNFNS